MVITHLPRNMEATHPNLLANIAVLPRSPVINHLQTNLPCPMDGSRSSTSSISVGTIWRKPVVALSGRLLAITHLQVVTPTLEEEERVTEAMVRRTAEATEAETMGMASTDMALLPLKDMVAARAMMTTGVTMRVNTAEATKRRKIKRIRKTRREAARRACSWRQRAVLRLALLAEP